VRTYEVVFIAAPTLSTEELEAFTAQMQGVVESRNGRVAKVDHWGKKSLAYRISRFRDAYYVILTLEGDGAMVAELERRFRVTDFIIRFLSVRIDEDLKRSEKLKAMRARKQTRRPATSRAGEGASPMPAEPGPAAG
jgi:small subunit ribosomal protein S6